MTVNSVQDLNNATAPELEAYFQSLLSGFGLSSLTATASRLATEGASRAEFVNALESTPEYQQRFPAIFTRRQEGLPPVTPAEILAFERQTSQLEQLYGLPKGFLTSKAQDYIATDVSYNQLQQQVAFAKNTLENGDPQTLAELDRLYGLDTSSGGLLAYAIDPNRALPTLTEQSRVADIAAQANEGGGFTLSLAEAKQLESQGIDPNAVRQRAGQIAQAGNVVQGIGDIAALDRQTQIKILSGDAKAIGDLRKQAEQIGAPFQGGGSFATTNAGVTGLGTK